jgi:predicted RNA-binding protein
MKANEIINEDWQKVNKKDKTAGMSRKAVKAYRRENPGSKLQTAVTTKPKRVAKQQSAVRVFALE